MVSLTQICVKSLSNKLFLPNFFIFYFWLQKKSEFVLLSACTLNLHCEEEEEMEPNEFYRKKPHHEQKAEQKNFSRDACFFKSVLYYLSTFSLVGRCLFSFFSINFYAKLQFSATQKIWKVEQKLSPHFDLMFMTK